MISENKWGFIETGINAASQTSSDFKGFYYIVQLELNTRAVL